MRILLEQTMKNVEKLHRDIGGFDMSYDEFDDFCRGTWTNEVHSYLHFDGF